MMRILKTLLIIVLFLGFSVGLNLLLWWLADNAVIVLEILIGVVLLIFGKIIYDSVGGD